MKLLSLLLLCLLFNLNASIIGLEKCKTFTLQNGLKVICIENNKLPIVSFSIWYKCGAQCDSLKKSGVAHYLEHMAFNLNEGAFENFLDDIGALRNALTSINTVCFFEIFVKDHLEDIFKNESQRLQFIKINDKTFENERGAILEERNMRVDNSIYGKTLEIECAHLFNRKIGGIPLIGWKKEIEDLTKEDLIEFHNKWFAPNNAIILIVGDVELENIKNLAEKYFGNIKEKPISLKIASNKKDKALKLINFKYPDYSNSVIIQYFYHVPFLAVKNLKKTLALQLGINILMSPANFIYKISELNKNLLNVNIDYEYAEFEYDIVCVSLIGVEVNNLLEYAEIWRFLQDRILKTNITTKELEEAKEQYLLKLSYEGDDLWSLTSFIAFKLVSGFSLLDIQNIENLIKIITPEECEKALKEVFSCPPICVTSITPKGYSND